MVSRRDLLEIDHPNHLCLDVTGLSVNDVVGAVRTHLIGLAAPATG